jgi:hypothetical protein
LRRERFHEPAGAEFDGLRHAQHQPDAGHPLGTGEATATMSRTHAEIQRLSDRIGAQVALAQSTGSIGADQVGDLLAWMYGLYALLRRHFVQEEENYFTLATDEPDAPQASAR